MTIKEDVFETIKSNKKALSSKEIVKETGHKYNSVRGAIQNLHQERKIKSVPPRKGKRLVRYKLCK